MALHGMKLAALRHMLEADEVSSLELAEACIARTEALQALNVYSAFDADLLRRQAREADARRHAGERGLLLGIPIALNDNIDAVGWPCAAGTRALAAVPPQEDAGLVQRLRAAGALVAGKTGMHELAFGITSNNALTRPVRNPWDPERIPGGSSGGAGAAVAAGLVPAAIGTDTGGSVRVPAALCGVTGFRPTPGRVPAQGIVPVSRTRDTAGPLALDVADCALLDEVLARAPTGLEILLPGRLRLGVPRERFWADLDPAVRDRAESALQALAAAGVALVEVALPGLTEASDAAGIPIALFEFVRDLRSYLHEARRPVSLEQVLEGVASPDVAAACRPLAAAGAIPEAAYRQALQDRERLQRIYATAFAHHRIDALVFPTTPRTAARIGEDLTVELNGRARPTLTTFIRNTDPGSIAGLPGVSLPIGLAGGLPVGLALDGTMQGDRRLLAIAATVESLLPAAPLPRPAP